MGNWAPVSCPRCGNAIPYDAAHSVVCCYGNGIIALHIRATCDCGGLRICFGEPRQIQELMLEGSLGIIEEPLPVPELIFGGWLEWRGLQSFRPHDLSKREEAEAGMMAWELEHQDPWEELDASP